MENPADALTKLDALLGAMNAAVSAMELQGVNKVDDVVRSAAVLQSALHTLSRRAAANCIEEEQMRRAGLRS